MDWVERMQGALTEKGWTKAHLAREANVSYDSLIKYLSGKVDKPRGETLNRIARALEINPVWLEHGDEGMRIETVPYAGIAQAGVFVDIDLHTNGRQQSASIAPDPRYPKARQYAWRVDGDSMDRAGILPGMFVLGVDYHDCVSNYHPVQTGDIVVVERLRFNGQEREVTIKKYWRDSRGEEMLLPESSNKKHVAIRMPRSNEEPVDETIRIIAYVAGAYTLFGKVLTDLAQWSA